MQLINISTLLVGALLFLTAVFLKPFVLIVRDSLVWKWIGSKLFDEQTIEDIVKLTRENELWATRAMLESTFLIPEPDGSYRYSFPLESKEIDPIELTSEERSTLMEKNDEAKKWRVAQLITLEKKSNQLDSIVKHYGQDKPNPIDAKFNELTDLYKSDLGSLKFDHVKSLEYIVSEIQDDPRMYRIKRELRRERKQVQKID